MGLARLVMILVVILTICSTVVATEVVNVLQATPPLHVNDRAMAQKNTDHIARIMESLPAGGAVYFPAGDYYFHGSALPNRGTIETTRPGQIIFGDGADVTNIIQTDRRKDFGFTYETTRKHVPTATIRIRDKGCRVRDLSVLPDINLPAGFIESAAIQIANIQYYPDHNIGIIETTGTGTRYLIDFVNITDVNIGRNLGTGIQSSHFFAVGVDIIGTGGEVKVRNADRLDTRIGVRLDNGNHCGQGGYYFENLNMIGRHGMNSESVFFDWVGGQAPFIRNCNALYVSGIHAGPLGSAGDRLEPTPEAIVYRRPDKSWDWFTLHNHPVVDEPDHHQRREWYGLPRHARILRIASEPRTGGTVWIEGTDFETETIMEAGDLHHATKIHWKTTGPAPGSSYYVEFEQPIEYRVHDLQWGYLMNCQLGEALQSGPEAYTLKFDDQGYGHLNPDFDFALGYGFFITNNFVLNGPFIFNGRVDYLRMEGNTTGVCDIIIRGVSEQRKASRISLSRNQINSVLVGDYVEQIKVDANETIGTVKIDAPNHAEFITINNNSLLAPGGHAIDINGNVRNLRIQDNDIRMAGGDGIVVTGAENGFITGNNALASSGKQLNIQQSKNLVIRDNLVASESN